MKPLLIAIALLLSTSVPAQQAEAAVQEVETADQYSFRAELDNGEAKELMRCANALTNSNINVRMKGNLTLSVDKHSELSVDTRRRLLTIEHYGSDPVERARTKQLVARAKACLDAPAAPETTTSTRSSSSSTSETETSDGTHYAYALRGSDIATRDLVQAFASAAAVTVNPHFTGDWTTSDDDGIAYSLDTRRHRISIDYHGDDAAVMERAKEKAQTIRTRLHFTPDTPDTPDERSEHPH